MKIPKETSVVGDNIGAGAMRFFSNQPGWPIAWIEIHLIYRVPALFQYGSGVVPICFVKKYFKKIVGACAMAKRATLTKLSVQ